MFTSKLIQRQGESKADIDELQRKLFDSGIEKDPMLSEIRSNNTCRGPRGMTPPSKPNVKSNKPIQVYRPREIQNRKSPPRPRTQDNIRASQVIGTSFGDLKDYQAGSKKNTENRDQSSSNVNKSPAIFESQIGSDKIPPGSQFFRQNSGRNYGENSAIDNRKQSNVMINKAALRPPQSPSQKVSPSFPQMIQATRPQQAGNVSFSSENNQHKPDYTQVETSFHKLDQRNYANLNSFSSKATKKPIMIMNLDVGDGKQANLFIFNDTEPWEKAFDFVERYNLPEAMVEPLAELIEQNKQRAMENLTKNTMRTGRDNDGMSDLLSEKSSQPLRSIPMNNVVVNRGIPENYNAHQINPNTQLRNEGRIRASNHGMMNEEISASPRHIANTPKYTTKFDNLGPMIPMNIGTQSSKNLGIADRVGSRPARKAIFDSNYGSTPHIYKPPAYTQFDRSPAIGIDLNYGQFNVGHRQMQDSNLSLDMGRRAPPRSAAQEYPRTLIIQPGSYGSNQKMDDDEDQYYMTPSGKKPQLQSTLYNGLEGREPLRMEMSEKQMLKAIFDKIDIDRKGNIKAYEVNLTPLNKDLKILLMDALASVDNNPSSPGFKSINLDGFCRAILDSGLFHNIKQVASR